MPDPAHTVPADLAQVPSHDVRALLGPDGRAILLLDGIAYVLRLTRNGKLILTK